MEHSTEFKRELRLLNVEASMLAFADLVALKYKDVDAFKLCYPEYSQYPEKNQQAYMRKILESAKFKKLLDSRKNRIKEGAIPVELEEIELIEGEEIAKEILRSAKAAPVGSKERADLFLRYEEIMQRNKVEPESEETEESPIHYLPLKCNQCPLYAKFNEIMFEKNGEHVRPDEMTSIISKAVELAYPDALEAYKILHGRSYEHDMKLNNEDFERELRQLKEKYGL